jgi:multiple sugar transport system ATP-binding protein
MAVVETRGLKKYFGEVRAVDDVDFSTAEGEFLVLLGPSGCGKTTLLRLIAGLEQPTAGEVWIGGQLVNGSPPRTRKIAMIFQSYALYPHMTVFDNIAFPLKAQGFPKGDRKKKVEWAAASFGIDKLLHRKPRQLSGGERQRVALARALVRQPAVFLLDEPLSNLDAQLRALARHELKQFQRRVGITTIYVTHDQVEAMGMGDRIAVMHRGKVQQVGTPRDIYDEPADTFVATFLGSPPMNLMEKDTFFVGSRPEHFLPKEVLGSEEPVVPFTFQVTRMEYLGADRLLYGVVPGTPTDTKVVARLPTTVTVTIQPGESYEFFVQAKNLKFFDKATGVRIEPQPL